ncbi:MAG: hypothetical protein A2W23_02630 [Planctomycetes bacterium RBG_16_43_13]|nr:MAG: hypothetical protein A2W23_02630 [Planctomycetes bacterium RBG_16_43_13]
MAEYSAKTPSGGAMPKGLGGEMGHDKAPKKCDVYAPQKQDLSRVDKQPVGNLGYPKQAWDYKY